MGVEIRKNLDYTADTVNFKGFGFIGTATAGQVTDIDYKLTEERLVYGGQAILKDHAFGDTITFQIVDKDNILGYGAGVVLGEYMKNWNAAADQQSQLPVTVDYPTKVLADLYLRIKYTSTGNSNVSVAINIFCVKNIT